MDFKEIEKVIDKYIDEIIEFRRDIHSYPELSGNEKRTSEKVIEKLKKLPVEIITNVKAEANNKYLNLIRIIQDLRISII